MLEDVKVSGKVLHKMGEFVRGDVHDTKLCLVQFDGAKHLHFTEKFTGGDRFAVIFFCQSRGWPALTHFGRAQHRSAWTEVLYNQRLEKSTK